MCVCVKERNVGLLPLWSLLLISIATLNSTNTIILLSRSLFLWWRNFTISPTLLRYKNVARIANKCLSMPHMPLQWILMNDYERFFSSSFHHQSVSQAGRQSTIETVYRTALLAKRKWKTNNNQSEKSQCGCYWFYFYYYRSTYEIEMLKTWILNVWKFQCSV